MGYELDYVEVTVQGVTRKHLSSKQEWWVKKVEGRDVFLQLAGFRQNGERNTFAMKHLLPKSKKGTTQEEKAERKLMHRIDHQGTNVHNPYQGAKVVDAGAQTRTDKYGNAMGVNSPQVQNTVIDLDLVDVSTVVYEIAKACLAAEDGGGWDRSKAKDVDVVFGKACVRTVLAQLAQDGAHYAFTHEPLADQVGVKAYRRLGDHSFEVYHLG